MTTRSVTEMDDALLRAAVDALRAANQVESSDVDRQVRQPDSWLLRHCYRHLARFGSAEATFAVAELLQWREPLASFRVLPILARRSGQADDLRDAVSDRLYFLRGHLRRPIEADQSAWSEQLLSIACAAAHVGDRTLAFASLERLDQARSIWTTIFAKEDLRALLAETVARVGLHPLTAQLVRHALRQHGEPGAHFVQDVALQAAQQIRAEHDVARSRRLLQRCVDAFRYATLTSLLSRRYAAATFALVGDVEAILEQVTIMANVQEAHRESGIAYRASETRLVRQVKRPRANPDVDFRLYTLKEAAERLDPAQISAQQRRNLADWIGYLGAESDGWTAAAATVALLHLQEIDHAVAVVDGIDRRDATRSEAFRVLVEGLLAVGETEKAAAQARKAVHWAQALPELHPERLTIWGLAKAYLDHGEAQPALAILEGRRPLGLGARLFRFFRNHNSEEDLREEALRMHAVLLDGEGSVDSAARHLDRIRAVAPRLLEGKALSIFYTEQVLEPMLRTKQYRLAQQFLRDVQAALGQILSREQPVRVEAVAELLVAALRALAQAAEAGTEPDDASLAVYGEMYNAARDLLVSLWQSSAQRGIWPTVYSVGGSLPLVIALAGSDAVVELARFAAEEGEAWRHTVTPAGSEEYEREFA